MARRGLTALLALAALAASCGLPDSFYLTPPSVIVQNDPTVGQFILGSKSANSEPEFRGFEVYYKLYSSPPPTAETNLGGASGKVEDLTSKGFLTLCQLGDSAPDARAVPLISIAPADRGEAFTITINVRPTLTDVDTNYSYDPPTGPIVTEEIDRHVAGTSRCKPFTMNAGNYAPSDPDVKDVYQAAAGANQIYIAMYAASYGLQELSTPIYSYPVYMGYLQISRFP